MPRYRLTIEYRGTRYRGWQSQKNARSVQAEILRAARELHGPVTDFQGAGRTDAGVHALGQVAHLDFTPPAGDARLIAAGLNDALPPDINILEARRADSRWHARHHAVGRSYLYQVSRRRTALGKDFVWWVKDRLDAEAMAGAAAGLVGMHDFASFSDRRIEEGKSTLVLLDEAAVRPHGDIVLVRLRASHFLWKMVRRVVGVLVQVGSGKLRAGQVGEMLEKFSPLPALFTAPPSGLFLEEVVYPGETYRRPLEPVMDISCR